MTMYQMALHHMMVSSRQTHADFVLPMEAERHASGAAESWSEA